MSSTVLISKAIDDLEAAVILMNNPNQHDNAGNHLCKSIEKFAKAYLEMSEITNYPKNGKDGHDISLLFKMLAGTDFDVTKFSELLKLQLYDSRIGYNYSDEDLYVDLKRYMPLVEEFKNICLLCV